MLLISMTKCHESRFLSLVTILNTKSCCSQVISSINSYTSQFIPKTAHNSTSVTARLLQS